MPFGDEVQTNTHHTHDHTPNTHPQHQPHTRSQHKRSLRSRDARQRRAQQRLHNRATHRCNYRSWRSALTPTPYTVLSQGTGSFGQPHQQKPLYDLTGGTPSHRRLQQQRSRQKQQHTHNPTIIGHSQQHPQVPSIATISAESLQDEAEAPTEPQHPQPPPHRHQTSHTEQTTMAGPDTTRSNDNTPEHTGSRPTSPNPARRAEPNTTFRPQHNTTFEELSGTPPDCLKQSKLAHPDRQYMRQAPFSAGWRSQRHTSSNQTNS